MKSRLFPSFASFGRALLVSWLLTLAAPPSEAQQPDTLRNPIPPPIPAPIGYQTDTGFGSSLAADGNLVVVGAYQEDLFKDDDDDGVVRVFNATTGDLLHVLKNPNPVGSTNFGGTLAISGTRVVVGCARDRTSANNAGRAYVYELSGPTPTVPTLILNNPSPSQGGGFGAQVNISGNLVAVSGANIVYVYDLAGASPSEPRWAFANQYPLDQARSFWMDGTKLAICEYNIDDHRNGRLFVYDLAGAQPYTPVWSVTNLETGFGNVRIKGNILAVTALGKKLDLVFDKNRVFVYNFTGGTSSIATIERPVPINPGELAETWGLWSLDGMRVATGYAAVGNQKNAAYVFDVSTNNPNVPIATLSGSGSGRFGSPVVFSNGKVVVGSQYDNMAALRAGAAFIYDLATPSAPVVTLTSPAPSFTTTTFGRSVALSGAFLLVGADGDVSGGFLSGRAYLYDLLSATPNVPKYTLPNPTPNHYDAFGFSVALSGSRAVVGAFQDDTSGTDAGSIYIYDFTRANPTEPWLTIPNPTGKHDLFGAYIAISGNFVVVGAPNENTGAADSGAVYVYDVSSATPTVPVLIVREPSSLAGARFGTAVAIAGKLLVVGAERGGTGVLDSGRVYVYNLASATPTVPIRTINSPAPSADDRFGWSVAISGTRVVVGAYRGSNFVPNAGSAYVYDLTLPTTFPTYTLHNPTPSAYDLFSSHLSISGSRVAVSAEGDDWGASESGSTFVFDLDNLSPAWPVATLHNPTPETGDNFGSSVSIDGTTLAVGSARDSDVGYLRGYAYVYAPSNPDWDGDGELDLYEYATYGDTEGHTGNPDPTGTGTISLIEHAFDRDPTVIDPASGGALSIQGGYLTMTIAKQAGLTYSVESGDAPNASFNAANTTILLDNATTLKVRDNYFVGDRPSRMLRVKVSTGP